MVLISCFFDLVVPGIINFSKIVGIIDRDTPLNHHRTFAGRTGIPANPGSWDSEISSNLKYFYLLVLCFYCNSS